MYYFPSHDPIKTIGGVSHSEGNEQATVISILLNDPQISYLEVGHVGQRVKKAAVMNKPITFAWGQSFRWNDLKPQAFDEKGNDIYEYLPKNKIEELKWYPVSEDSKE